MPPVVPPPGHVQPAAPYRREVSALKPVTSASAPDIEQQLRTAVGIANVPTLLMVLVQLTGDLRWLDEPYRPSPGRGLTDNDTGRLPEAVQAEIRSAALEAILGWRAGAPMALSAPDEDLLLRMLSVSMGEEIPREYGAMMAADLGVASVPGQSAGLQARRPPEGFRVLIVGAGVSGLCAAVRFEAAGIPYTILEKNDTVGGTWLENRYPGCGVDTPSHLYSFSFVEHDWSHYFALRDDLHGYLERVATEFGLRRHIRLRTEVLSAAYDAQAREWEVRARTSVGTEETLRSNVLITAVGAFNRPVVPDIPGLETFEGSRVHTARWPENVDLTGKRVGVIGNGASAMQLVPAIADEVASLTVFQRTPHWVAPFEKFKRPVPEALRVLMREVPLYRMWYRLRLAWIWNDRLHPALQKDAEWAHPDRAVNAINDRHREYFTRYLEDELGDRPDLAAAVVPTYPPYGKRILMDNGWFKVLARDHVHLVPEPIAEVRSDRVLTGDGAEHPLDVLVLATGFDVVRFLASVDIRGRSGATLRETWDDDDAKAYLGVVVPDLPNFFCLYGPNTQAGHGGSIISTAECQTHYVLTLLQEMFARGIRTIECRQEVHDEYNARVDAAHEAMIWTHPGMETYYRNKRGRVVANSPWRIVDFWHLTRHPNLDDFDLELA
jgi:4-hydroxyacetophenone monooxygenase